MEALALLEQLITDSEGASKRLSERFGRSFGIESVRNLVKDGTLRSLIFVDGQLRVRQPGESQGKTALFLRADLDLVEPPKRAGRPGKEQIK